MNINDNNNNGYEIKMDGEFHTFEGGAIRYTKTGKGRFDLIPEQVVVDVVSKIDDYLKCKHCGVFKSFADFKTSCIISIYEGYYVYTILDIVVLEYIKQIENLDEETLLIAFIRMLRDLAIHYEKGADKYGEGNWKKGIPPSSFRDSAIRHLSQYLTGETDEPHAISSIWNMFGLIWTGEFKNF